MRVMNITVLKRICSAGILIAAVLLYFPGKSYPAGPDNLKGENQREDYSIFESSEYKDLPRVSFKLLIEDSEFLKGEKFKGILYPRKFTRAPWALVPVVGKNKNILIACSRSGKNSMYVIVPETVKKRITRLIKARGRMYFIYTPVSTLGNMPVVQMIDEVTAEPAADTLIPSELSRYYPAIKGSKWTIEVGRRVRIIEYEILEIKKNYAKGTKREIIPGKTGSEKINDFYIYYDRDKITTVEEGFNSAGVPYKQSDVILKTPLSIGTRWSVKTDNEERKREIAGVHDTVTVGVREFKDVAVVREDSSVQSEGGGYFAVTYYFYALDVGFIGCKIDSADQIENLKQYNQIDDWFIQRSE